MKKKTIWITGAAVAAVLIVGGAGLAIADPFDDPFGTDRPLTGSTLDQASTAALNAVGSGTVTDSQAADGDDAYAYEVEVTLADGTDVEVALDDAFGVLWVDGMPAAAAPPAPTTQGSTSDQSSDDDSALAPLTDSDRESASAAALAALPAGTVGTVTEVERSDDVDHAYEVEITLENGQDVDVELDESFTIVKVDDLPAA